MSRYHGSEISGSQQCGAKATTATRTAKRQGLYQQNNNFASASRFFVHFLAVAARLRHETSLFYAPALWST